MLFPGVGQPINRIPSRVQFPVSLSLEANVEAYEIHWATGDGATAPSASELLESIPVTSLSSTVNLVMRMYDSWGDGWNSALYYIKSSDGMELASGTLQTGTYGEHVIYNISGAGTLLITVTRGFWPAEIYWELKLDTAPEGEYILTANGEYGTFPVDMPFSVASGSGGSGLLETTVPSTSIPSGANHLLTFSRLTSGATSSAAWTPIVDFVPPGSSPTSIQFADADGGVGIIAGQITVGRATDETGISEYKIYFGTSSSSKVPSAQAIASISTSVDPLVATLPATTVATGASYLLVFSSSSSGENSQPASVMFSDLQQPTSPPGNVSFTDVDPHEGYYAGREELLQDMVIPQIIGYGSMNIHC